MLWVGYLVLGLVLSPAGCKDKQKAAPSGFLQGHLHITSLRTVEPADGNPPPTVTAETYAQYPLVVLSEDGKQEVARVTANANGDFRIPLPPGAYILDVQDRVRKHVRAKPLPFTVISGQSVHVDLDMDTGIR